MIAATIFSIIAAFGVVMTSIQAILTSRFRRRRPFAGGLHEQASRRADFISILKPVCGIDDELEENLLSFVSLPDIDYEVILSVEDRDDPAMPILQAAVRDHPDVFRLVVGSPRTSRGVVNRKVERLMDAARVARGSILLISDSNVRIAPADIAATVSVFDDPRTGCVSNLFVGMGEDSLGARLEALHLLSFVVPGTVTAMAVGVPCVVGKSMAISRSALNAIGGFEAFRFVLAEDQAIGLAVRRAGYEVVVSPTVVRNVIVHRTISRALDRQVRWNKIRYAFSKGLFAAEILVNPLPLAFVAFLFGAPAAVPLLVLAARLAQVSVLARSAGAAAWLWAVPLLDLLMLYAWFVPFFSNEVVWRGTRARIGRDTVLVQGAA